MLRGVLYAADGSVVVTDRHRLLRIAGAHSFAEPFVADAKTGVALEGNYPDTSRIIPTDSGMTEVIVNGPQIKTLAQRVKLAVDAAKLADKSTKIVAIQKTPPGLEILVQNSNAGVDVRLFNECETSGEDILLACNAEYLLDAVNVFVDAGTTQLTVDFYGKLRPIILRDKQNGIEAVVLPYRIPSE